MQRLQYRMPEASIPHMHDAGFQYILRAMVSVRPRLRQVSVAAVSHQPRDSGEAP